jgi:oxalate decarboxylase
MSRTPVLSGKELPTFKFELEKSAGKVMGNSFGKEATVEQLPISKESPVYQCNSNPA